MHTAPRRTLFRKYAVYFAGLVSIALVTSGLLGLYFAYSDARVLIEELQREKVRGVAWRIEQFARLIEAQLKAPLLARHGGAPEDLHDLHLELIRLLRQAAAVMDLAWIDSSGVQQVKVSRIAPDEIGLSRDWSTHPAFTAARSGTLYTSRVYFRRESEPYMTLAVGSDSVLLAEVNLKSVWDVVSAITVGAAGFAYVVDFEGRLISHPDTGLVLKNTNLSALEQVSAALSQKHGADVSVVRASADGSRRLTLTAHAPIPVLGWHTFVEQPLSEAFEPLYSSILRTGVMLVIGAALAVLAALALARKISAPIHELKEGATRIGEGRLQERIEIASGDELQALADQFNDMAEKLRESYAGLEQKIEERTRQLAAANASKSRFIAVASHDLRQPVHALGLFVAQFKEAQSPAQRERLLGKIQESSEAVSELLDALLDISKLDAGTVKPQPVEFQVQILLTRLEYTFSAAAQAKGLRLRVRPSRLRVMTDPLLLERVLTNLASNAVRYTREGGVLIACRCRRESARVEIWDTGIGIRPDQTERIFDEFYQAHAPVDDRAKGLGLGLAIVNRLTRLLELKVKMRSIEGRGSLFAVEVPRATGTAAPVSAAPEPQAQMRFDGALALVVDDDANAREAAAGLLTQWGWRVVTAAGADEALTALGNLAPTLDAIISDYRLGGGELGIQVIERIRAAAGAAVPAIVVVSGDVTAELREATEREGVQLLHKPLQAARLRTLLHHLQAQRDASPSAAG